MSNYSSTSSIFSKLETQILRVSTGFMQLEQVLSRFQLSKYASELEPLLRQNAQSLKHVTRLVKNLEEERQGLDALVNTGQIVNSTLDLDQVLQEVMDTIVELTSAERGFLMLRNPNGSFTKSVARNWERESLADDEIEVSDTIINRVVDTGAAVLTTNAQEDPRFDNQESIVSYNLRSILCVPLLLKDDLIGVIYTDNRLRSGLFTRQDAAILQAFANQAAVAIDNAQLFESLRKTLAEVTALKNLMDSVFTSMASGVITLDTQEKIMLCNRAAEAILGRDSRQLIGFSMKNRFPDFAENLHPFVSDAMLENLSSTGIVLNEYLMGRGNVSLRLSFSPLKDSDANTQGVAIVMEDQTEKARLEAKGRLFERMVSPQVIRQLDPDSLQLDGKRSMITTFFADIRGFTSFSEANTPEDLFRILNLHLAVATEAILREGGTVDKFMGDAILAWFNAPVTQKDHAMRAIRSALGMKERIIDLHRMVNPNERLTFGVGIHTGEAVLGLVGTKQRLEYTAIGDSVNTAKRIQENAEAEQILISDVVYALVKDQVIIDAVRPIQAKGKRNLIPVYAVKGLR